MPSITNSDKIVPPPQEMQKAVAGVEPAKRWSERDGVPRGVSASPVMDRIHELCCGGDAVTADKAVDLYPERNESDEVNDSQEAKKEPAGEEMGGLFDMLTPEEAGQEGKAGAVFGDKAIEGSQ